jgi:hypothetical protein
MIFPINSNIKPTRVLSQQCTKINHKTPRVVLLVSLSLRQPTDHTYTLAEAIKNKYIKYSLSIHPKTR